MWLLHKQTVRSCLPVTKGSTCLRMIWHFGSVMGLERHPRGRLGGRRSQRLIEHGRAQLGKILYLQDEWNPKILTSHYLITKNSL